MRMNQPQIATAAQDIQRKIGLKTDIYPEYALNISDEGITIHGARHHLMLNTLHLSDIHAILRECHPDGPYYIAFNAIGCAELPSLMLYSYDTAPSELSTEPPAYLKAGKYIINLSAVDPIILDPNETIHQSIERAIIHIRQKTHFIRVDPSIRYYHAFVKIQQHISMNDNTRIPFNIYAKSMNRTPDIQLTVEMYDSSDYCHNVRFVLPIAHKDQHAAIIDQHIQALAHNLSIPPAFTAPNGELSRYIQRCVETLRKHYVYTPTLAVAA